jgi:hypothetical protein
LQATKTSMSSCLERKNLHGSRKKTSRRSSTMLKNGHEMRLNNSLKNSSVRSSSKKISSPKTFADRRNR